MNAARIGLASLALVTVLFALTWVLLTVNGPLVVERGELEPAVCDEVWRQAEEDIGDWGPVAFLPVTRAQIFEATMDQPRCGTVMVERLWLFARSVTYDCL